jgi:hypothetical protein
VHEKLPGIPPPIGKIAGMGALSYSNNSRRL